MTPAGLQPSSACSCPITITAGPSCVARHNRVLDVTTDPIRGRGVEDLVVERDSGTAGQRRHDDPSRARSSEPDDAVDPDVQAGMGDEVVTIVMATT